MDGPSFPENAGVVQEYIGGLCIIPSRSRTRLLCVVCLGLHRQVQQLPLKAYKREREGGRGRETLCCSDVIHASEASEGGG